MSDYNEEPFNPNAGMFFAPAEYENTFARTPANVTTDFIQEAHQNVAAATSAPPSEAYPVQNPDTDIPASIPSRPSTAAATTSKKRKRMSNFRFNHADEVSDSPAAVTTPAASTNAAALSSPNSQPPAKKRMRKAGKKQLNARVIPRSLDECDEADKELITMREGGFEWKAIRARWAELTGENTATSTLPNRYARLKYVALSHVCTGQIAADSIIGPTSRSSRRKTTVF